MRLFFSGHGFTFRSDPENVMSECDVMLSYWDIKRNLQKKRFRRLAKVRNETVTIPAKARTVKKVKHDNTDESGGFFSDAGNREAGGKCDGDD